MAKVTTQADLYGYAMQTRLHHPYWISEGVMSSVTCPGIGENLQLRQNRLNYKTLAKTAADTFNLTFFIHS